MENLSLVLFDGEYLYKDMSYIGGFDRIRENQIKQYSKYIGVIVGDFRILQVEYDWGKRSQRAYVECTKCGEKSYFYHVADWLRGKGRGTRCRCTKEALRREAIERKRVTYEVMGQTGTIPELCRHFGISYKKVQYRISEKTRSVEQAIMDVLSLNNEHEYSFNGYHGNMKAVCEHFGVRQQTILYRMKYKGMSFEEAMSTPNQHTGGSLLDGCSCVAK